MKFLFLLLLYSFFSCEAYTKNILDLIKLPKNFTIQIYSKVPNARQMALSPNGTLFVGSRYAGNLYAIKDNDGDGYGETITIIASKLRLPTGIAFKDKNLYIGVVNKILVMPDIEKNLDSPIIKTIKNDLPNDLHHGWKYLKISKDNRIYFNIGAPCNVCEVEDPYGTIASVNMDGSNFKIYARGVRNSLGFLWHPFTNDFWFTDNGRDGLGDDLPDCELNLSEKSGYHFGFPYCYNKNIRDKTINYTKNCDQFIPSLLNLGAHVAPLGIDINIKNSFPAVFNNTIFIAEHGSWDRSRKNGYRISYARLSKNSKKIIEKGVFAEGWVQNEKTHGRPVDILFNHSGGMFVSDDLNGYIYLIKYKY